MIGWKGAPMSHNALSWRRLFSKVNLWFSNPEEGPLRYRALRRNMIIIMVLVTLLPLSMMAVINHYEYQQALRREIISPMRTLVSKTKHSFELFLTERLSAVSFIASAYSFQDLSDQNTLNRIFRVMKQEFGGFVDLGLIDASGVQVSYVGPYELKGRNTRIMTGSMKSRFGDRTSAMSSWGTGSFLTS